MTEKQERERGYTLVEALVVMIIFGAIIGIIVTVLIQVSYSTADNMTRTSQIRNAELGLMQIDRQVRSGNVIIDPDQETSTGSGVDPGYSLRVYTQTDGVFQCVQWRVKFNDEGRGQLEYRSWDPNWESLGGDIETWATVAHDLVRDPAGDPPFTGDGINETSATSSVDVSIFVQGERTNSAPAVVQTVLTGRNTVYGYPIDRCDNIPAP